jgi:hypothetical protein
MRRAEASAGIDCGPEMAKSLQDQPAQPGLDIRASKRILGDVQFPRAARKFRQFVVGNRNFDSRWGYRE